FLVSPYANEFLGSFVGSKEAADVVGFCQMRGGDDGGHDAADAVENGNRRIVALGGEATVEHNVALEQGTGSVDQGIVFVVAFHQHSIETGNGARGEGARPLDQPGEQSKDRGRVAFGGGGFARSQPDFALRHGQPGERVDHQQHVLAAGTKVFGDGDRGEAGTDAEQWVLVGGGHDNNGTPAAVFTERVQKFSHFASTLADQAENGEVGVGVARHHADQSAFADAAAAKDPDPLATPASQEGIDSADAAAERGANGGSLQGKWGFAIERITLAARGSRAAVNGISRAIQHAPQQLFAQAQRRPSSPNHDLVPVADSGRPAQGHGKNRVTTKADNLARPVPPPGIYDFAGLAYGTERAFGFDQLADDLYHSATPAQCRRVLELGKICGEDLRSHSACLSRWGRRQSRRRAWPFGEQVKQPGFNFLELRFQPDFGRAQ